MKNNQSEGKISIADVSPVPDGECRQAVARIAAASEHHYNRLFYINKKAEQNSALGRKGSNCSTAISETVRKSNIQLFREFVKREKYAWSIDSLGATAATPTLTRCNGVNTAVSNNSISNTYEKTTNLKKNFYRGRYAGAGRGI